MGLPHPDDIVIDNEHGVRLVGPIDEEGRASLATVIAFRNALVLQHHLDERLASKDDFDDPLKRPGTALVLAFLIDRLIAERHRLTDGDMFALAWGYGSLSKRELLKQVFQAWRAMRLNFPRGTVFPPQEVATPTLRKIAERYS